MSFQPNGIVGEMDKLKKFAYKLCRNKHDAEDLLQATVLKAIEKRDMFKEGTNLFSWSSKIMYNDFVSAYRRKVKFESKYDAEDLIKNKSVKPRQEKKALYGRVSEAMDGLNQKHRQVLDMVCIQGMRYKDVAEQLSIPIGTVRSRLSRAREQLKDVMDVNDNERIHLRKAA